MVDGFTLLDGQPVVPDVHLYSSTLMPPSMPASRAISFEVNPWAKGPYKMHATALNALVEWGRVHEVRRSQPRLSGPLILFS